MFEKLESADIAAVHYIDCVIVVVCLGGKKESHQTLRNGEVWSIKDHISPPSTSRCRMISASITQVTVIDRDSYATGFTETQYITHETKLYWRL